MPTSSGASAALRRKSMRGERLRRWLRSSTLIGTFVMEHPSPAALHSIALAGFEFAILDLEHGAASPHELPHLLAVAEAVGLPVIVRVSDPSPGTIARVLDLLPAGIMLPRVPDGLAAQEWVSLCLHPPQGARGYAPLTGLVGAGQGRDLPQPFLVLQIETRDALRDVAEIAAIPDVDAVFVGPFDLAMALGCTADAADPLMRSAIERIAAEAGSHAILGAYVHRPDDVGRWRDEDYRLLCVGFDGQVFREGVERLRRDVDAAIKGERDG